MNILTKEQEKQVEIVLGIWEEEKGERSLASIVADTPYVDEELRRLLISVLIPGLDKMMTRFETEVNNIREANEAYTAEASEDEAQDG